MFLILIKLILKFINDWIGLKSYIYILFLLASFSSLFGIDNDSIKVYKTSPVNVSAESISNTIMNYSGLSKIRNEEIRRIAPVGLSKLLSFSPGVAIKDYGGAGAIKTISIRGGSSSQTLVMIDGMPISSTQNSSVDFSLIPVSMVNSLEISRGGASAIFGTNALTGVVNIISDQNLKNNFNIKLFAGSFEDYLAALGFTFADSLRAININLNYEDSKNKYTVQFNRNGINIDTLRDNAYFNNFIVSINAYDKSGIFDFESIKFNIIAKSASRAVPGPVLKDRLESSKAKLEDKEILSIINAKINNIMLASLMFKFSESEYFDPDNLSINKNGNLFLNKDLQISFKNIDNIDFIPLNYELYSNICFSTLSGDMIDNSNSNYADRFSLAFGAKSEYISYFDAHKFSFISALRSDYFSDFGTALSPFIGFIFDDNFPLNSSLSFNYSYNFRAPNFNEMYYLNFGTKDLKPEKSHSFNLGLNLNPFNPLNIEFNVFYLISKDQIVAVPKSSVAWSARNLAKTHCYGIEFSSSYSYVTGDFLSTLSFNYTYQQSKDFGSDGKYLPYIPQEIISALISLEYKNFSIAISSNYNGFMYVQPDNYPESIIKSNYEINISSKYSINIYDYYLNFIFNCNNLTNQKRQYILNYPLPLRYFRFGIELAYK